MRKIIQISNAMNKQDRFMYALCNDGTLWESINNDDWIQVTGVPEDDTVDRYLNPPYQALPESA